MKRVILPFLLLLPSPVLADSCVTLEGSTLHNRCKMCMDVDLQELRPRGDVVSALMRGVPHKIRLMPGQSAAAPPGRLAITDLRQCE